ncbi:MAG: hypothetical protein AAGJ82_07395 [Bacteroidota bacterium]
MSLWDRIKANFYQRALPEKAARHLGRPPRNLDEARSIAILFPAGEIDDRKVVLKYAERLRKQNKSVTLLGYLPVADAEATFPFTHFTDKEIDWAQRPKGEGVAKFWGSSYDALVCLFAQSNLPTEMIVLKTPAALKIGPVPQQADTYDLMLDVSPSTRPQVIIDHYEKILALTKQPKPMKVV